MQKINKKALMFEPLLILFVVITLSAALYNILISEGETANLGKTSLNIINLDKEAKLKLDLAEQAALYNIYNSINKLGENSGYSEKEKQNCPVWKKECPITKEIVKENLKIYLQNSFNDYAKSQELNYYTVDIKEENNKLSFTFNSPNILFKKENIEYTINHKFTKEVDYNLNVYQNLYSKFHAKLLEKCPEEELSIDEELKVEGLTCEQKEQVLEFKYPQDKFYLGEKEKSSEYPIQPVIKFKITKTIKLT